MDRIFHTPRWLSLGLAAVITFGILQGVDGLAHSQATPAGEGGRWAVQPAKPTQPMAAEQALRPAA